MELALWVTKRNESVQAVTKALDDWQTFVTQGGGPSPGAKDLLRGEIEGRSPGCYLQTLIDGVPATGLPVLDIGRVTEALARDLLCHWCYILSGMNRVSKDAHFGHRDHSDRSIVISEIGGS